MKEISVQEFKEKMDNGDNETLLLDVREPFERYQSNINYEPSMLVPLDDLAARLDELEDYKDRDIICMCRSGGRSSKACALLEKKGFSKVYNLTGGINQWARDIDSSLPEY